MRISDWSSDVCSSDLIIDAAVASGAVVGTVMLVAEDGTTVYARAAGFADREAALPMAETTLFRLASLTKTIVSAAALALVEDRKSTRLNSSHSCASRMPSSA